jgi:metallophosphoesterase (TIGR00282 family)
MNILYVGDVMGEMGLQVIEKVLPQLRQERRIDLVIAQAENVSEGRGLTVSDFERLKNGGVDFCTGGNWTLYRDEIVPALENPDEPIIRPANYPVSTAGKGYKFVTAGDKKVLVVSLLGQIVGRDADKPFDNPLKCIDQILADTESQKPDAVVVNFHGDFSSEKVVIGHYLDGRASVVVGDHWHVPTADARVLPGGTAHMTDVGMCGALNSSLGVTYESIIERWRSGHPTKNILATSAPYQFNALLVSVNERGLAEAAEHIQIIL